MGSIGGVVSPGGTILHVIPKDDGVIFETRVDPASVDQVFVGQDTKVMLSAFNQRTTPELYGKVKSVSPDIVVDPNSGASFYRTQILVPGHELARLNGLEVVPGMPIEAFLQTGARSVLSYLTKPLTDQLNRAFREE